MTDEKQKREGTVPLDKQRVKIISNYISKQKSTGRETDVVEQGQVKTKKAFWIPRDLLRLNPYNHRFTTSLRDLINERVDDGLSPDFDLSSKEDVKQIRNMLKGIHPPNPERKSNYDTLLQEVKNRSEDLGKNGLKELTIITADGTYVNGNRRDTVLDDLQELETKKKKGGNPSKFDKIEVVVCSENITYSDIRQMEIKEQVSSELRDEYDYMNTSILIKEEFDNLLAEKGKGKEKQVIKTIASRIEGKGEVEVTKYLKFLEFVNHVLELLELDGQYNKINTKMDLDKGKSKPVTTIVREYVDDWSKAKDAEAQMRIIQKCAAYCQGVFKTARDPGTAESYKYNSRNHRDFKTYRSSKKATEIIDDSSYWDTHDFTSDASVEAFGDRIQKAEELKKKEDWIQKPVKILDSVEGSLKIIDESLVGFRGKEVKSLLLQAKALRYIDEFETKLKSIRKLLEEK